MVFTILVQKVNIDMKIELNDLLDKSFVISIDDARLNFFYEQFKSAGFEKLPKPVVQGIKLK